MLINTIAQRQNEQLIAAVKDGNFGAVSRLYSAKADFNIKDENGNDLLSITGKNLSGNVDSFKRTALMSIKKEEQLKESSEKSKTKTDEDLSMSSIDDILRFVGVSEGSSTKKNKNKSKKKNNKKPNQQQNSAAQVTKPAVKDIDKSKTPDKKTKDSTAVVENSATISTTPSSISSVNQEPTTPTEKKTSTTVTAPVVDNVKSSTKSTVSVKSTVAVKKEISSKQPEFSQEKRKTQLKQGQKTQKTEITQPLAEPVVAASIIQQGAAVLKENVSNFMEFKAENEGAERSKNGFILLKLLQRKKVSEARNFVSQCNGIIDFNVFDRDMEDFPLQAAIRNKQRDFVENLSQQPIHTSNFGRVARFMASEYVNAYQKNDNDTVRYYVDIWNNIKNNYIGQQQTIFGKNSSYIEKTIEFCRIVDSCFFKGEFDYKEITQAGKDLTIARTQAMQTMVDGDVKRILQQDNPESYNSNSIRMNGLNGNYSTLSTRPLMQSMRVVQPMPVMQPIQVMPVMQPMPPMQPRQVIQSTPATIVRVNRNQGNQRDNGNGIVSL